MDDVEAIKQLKARYCRTMDTKDWAGMRQVFTDDVVVDTTGSGGPVVTGADAFMEFLLAQLGDIQTVHQCHTPEITLTTATTATGVWAMADILRLSGGSDIHGYGHYHEQYRKEAGEWRISGSTLTRLLTGDPEAASPRG
ncbi:nuclear transport factor 2 family protein [Nocardia sp. NBC_01377]|uniref:nuclear transport factor 2 family protein n=1 Tax=Nocardia sp. NBC_01377 TaxID=2903595 RepID=UPI003252C130